MEKQVKKDNVKVVTDLITDNPMTQQQISEKTGIKATSVYKILKYKLITATKSGKGASAVFSIINTVK